MVTTDERGPEFKQAIGKTENQALAETLGSKNTVGVSAKNKQSAAG